MGNSYQERLSAWVDDELGEFETRRVTDEVLKSEAARSRLKHYQMIGSAIRDEHAVALDQSFSDRVMAEIATLPEEEQWDLDLDSDVMSTHKSHRGVSWLKVLAGGAIAASVALVSLTIFKSIHSLSSVDQQVGRQASATATPEMVPQKRVADTGTVAVVRPPDLAQPVSSPAAIQQIAKPIPPAMQDSANARLLGGYLATHAEYASRRTMLPQARIMGFDLPVDEEP